VGYYSGSDGLMKVGDDDVATVTTWSYTASQETLDVTTLGDRDRQLIGGVRSVSGSASISWYSDSTNAVKDTQASALLNKLIKADVSNAPVASEVVTLSLGINDGSANKVTTMEVILTSIAMTSSQGEVLSAEVSFEATKAPTAVMDK